MLTPTLPLAPARAAPGPLALSTGVDPAANPFALLLAGVLPLPAAVAAPPPAGGSDRAGGLRPTALPGASAAPTMPAPAAPAAAPPGTAVPAVAGRVAPPLAERPNAAAGRAPEAGVVLATGMAGAPPPPAPPGTDRGAAAPFELRARPAPPLEGPPSTPNVAAAPNLAATPNLAAAPNPGPDAGALAPLAASPPVAFDVAPVATAARPAPAVAAAALPAASDRTGPPAKALEVQPDPAVRAREVPLAGSELADRPAGSDAAADPAVELAEVAPGRAERTASEPPASSQRAAAPPLVQIGVQLAAAATRRVERLVVQLEPAALGRVEVRLDFSHDHRVSALIAADRPETLEVLQRDSRVLERQLQDAGLRLADNALSFSLRQEQRQPQGGAAPSGLPPEPPAGPLAQDDVRPAPWLAVRRLLDISI